MIRLFCRWLQLRGVTAARLRVAVQIHESADVDRAEQFWTDVVGIPVTALAKTTLKRNNPKSKRRNVGERYVGCCRIDVQQPKSLYREVQGLWDGVITGTA